MRNVVIGTAGHVDHGKTALVKRLTGVDTDRLAEEKRRGMSIELGFAAHALPSGRTIDFVDVPGHERFIRNMVCGAGGIDAAALVVAADDGPMPQTEEHLLVLELLGIERGLVVLSKIDLVDEELLDIAEQETREVLAGTPLEDAPMIRVSTKTGVGVADVDAALDRLCGATEARDHDCAFRLPVDRIISVTGTGTVVTGTIAAGRVSVGETVQVFPDGRQSKVRSLQSRGQSVQAADAGDRVGLGLVGVEASSVQRGITVAAPESLIATHLLNVRLSYLPQNGRPLADKQRVHVYTGTDEAIGRIVLMESDRLLPGESGLAQLRLEKQLAPAPGDRFIVRSLSPLATIGGGIILEAATRKFRAHHHASAKTPVALRAVYAGGRGEAVAKVLADAGAVGCGATDVSSKLALVPEAVAVVLDDLVRRRAAVRTAPNVFLSASEFEQLKMRVCDALSRHYESRPLQSTIPTEDLKTRVGRTVPRPTWEHALAELAGSGRLCLRGTRVGLAGYVPELSEKQQAIIAVVARTCRNAGLRPLWPREDICPAAGNAPPRQVLSLVDYLISQGRLARLGTGAVMDSAQLAAAQEIVTELLSARGQITLPEVRDAFGIGRHPTQAILEHLDSMGVTRRDGVARVLGESGLRAIV